MGYKDGQDQPAVTLEATIKLIPNSLRQNRPSLQCKRRVLGKGARPERADGLSILPLRHPSPSLSQDTPPLQGTVTPQGWRPERQPGAGSALEKDSADVQSMGFGGLDFAADTSVREASVGDGGWEAEGTPCPLQCCRY